MKTSIERLPDAELEVMLVLWHRGEPMSVAEIAHALAPEHQWKTATVHVLLTRLTERGFVTSDKTSYKHYFTPSISEADYRSGEQKTLLQRFFGGSAKNMIAALLWADDLTEDDLDELSQLVKKRKEDK